MLAMVRRGGALAVICGLALLLCPPEILAQDQASPEPQQDEAGTLDMAALLLTAEQGDADAQ